MSEKRRLHPAAVGALAIAGLRQLALPIVLAAFIGGGVSTESLVNGALFTVIGTLGSTLVAAVQWTATWWSVDGDSVRLRQGVLTEKVTAIPLERVQAIDTVRGPVQRLFGVVALHVQAAGGGARAEIVLKAVSEADAEELREAVRRATEGAARVQPAESQRTDGGPSTEWHLTRGWLVIAALTSGSLGVLVPVVAGASQFLDNLLDTDEAQRLVPNSLDEAALLAGAVVLAAWMLSFLGTLVAFAGFTLVRDESRVRIRRGVIERREAAVPVARIHAVRVVESPLREVFGLAQVRIDTAGYAREPASAQTLLPLVRRRDVPALIEALLPEFRGELEGLEPLPRAAARRYMLPPIVVAVLAAAVLAVLLGPVGLAAIALAVPAAGLGWARYRTAGWRHDDARVVIRFRRLARTTAVADSRRLQAVSVSTTPLQRRARLATLAVDVASGRHLGLRHLESRTADGLFAALGLRAAPRELGER
jgi:putative membrane protein